MTGAARRIGAGIVSALHDAGMHVAIHHRDSAADADALAGKCNERRSDSARTFCADLLDEGMPEALIREVINWSGRLDLLVNNASTFYPTPVGEITEAAWTDLVGTNLKVPLFLSQAAAPHLAKTGGNIVNIVDIHATRPLRDHAVYCSAKAGLIMLTRALARELAPEVRVNGISPGAIAWPEAGLPEPVKAEILEKIPLGRSGSPADIAGAVLFLARDSTYTTGQVIAIDGGRSTGW